jgi:hypothetical protein
MRTACAAPFRVSASSSGRIITRSMHCSAFHTDTCIASSVLLHELRTGAVDARIEFRSVYDEQRENVNGYPGIRQRVVMTQETRRNTSNRQRNSNSRHSHTTARRESHLHTQQHAWTSTPVCETQLKRNVIKKQQRPTQLNPKRGRNMVQEGNNDEVQGTRVITAWARRGSKGFCVDVIFFDV